jgi:hypothetical protein
MSFCRGKEDSLIRMKYTYNSWYDYCRYICFMIYNKVGPDYLKVKAIHPAQLHCWARKWPLKLYLYTANGLQRADVVRLTLP